MPVADTDKIIIDHKEIHDLISSHYTKSKEYNNASDQIERATKTFVEFQKGEATARELFRKPSTRRASVVDSFPANKSVFHSPLEPCIPIYSDL